MQQSAAILRMNQPTWCGISSSRSVGTVARVCRMREMDLQTALRVANVLWACFLRSAHPCPGVGRSAGGRRDAACNIRCALQWERTCKRLLGPSPVNAEKAPLGSKPFHASERFFFHSFRSDFRRKAAACAPTVPASSRCRAWRSDAEGETGSAWSRPC